MANARIGSHPSHGYQVVETIDTTAKQLEWNDSGKVFMCVQNATADVLINLPKLSTEMAGWHCKFILHTNSSNDFIIMGYGLPAAGGTTEDNDSINFRLYPTDGNSTTASATGDGVQFANAGGGLGMQIEMITDGTSWYALGFGGADADISVIDS